MKDGILNQEISLKTVVTLSWTTTIHLYGLDLSGTTQKIASALNDDCALVLMEQKYVVVSAMAPDLLCWNSDRKSKSADYERRYSPNDINGVSEWSDKTTLKDK